MLPIDSWRLEVVPRLIYRRRRASRVARVRSVDCCPHGCAAGATGRVAAGATWRANDRAGDAAAALTETHTEPHSWAWLCGCRRFVPFGSTRRSHARSIRRNWFVWPARAPLLTSIPAEVQ